MMLEVLSERFTTPLTPFPAFPARSAILRFPSKTRNDPPVLTFKVPVGVALFPAPMTTKRLAETVAPSSIFNSPSWPFPTQMPALGAAAAASHLNLGAGAG